MSWSCDRKDENGIICGRTSVQASACGTCPLVVRRCEKHGGKALGAAIATHKRWKHGAGRKAQGRRPRSNGVDTSPSRLLPSRRHKLKAARASKKIQPVPTFTVERLAQVIQEEVDRRVDAMSVELVAKARQWANDEAERLFNERMNKAIAAVKQRGIEVKPHG